MDEEGAAGAGPGLGETLGGHDAKGETGVDDVSGQRLGGGDAALHDLAEADLAGVADTLVDGLEGTAVERSGVWTVWPARRRSSAKATTPGVSPWAW